MLGACKLPGCVNQSPALDSATSICCIHKTVRKWKSDRDGDVIRCCQPLSRILALDGCWECRYRPAQGRIRSLVVRCWTSTMNGPFLQATSVAAMRGKCNFERHLTCDLSKAEQFVEMPGVQQQFVPDGQAPGGASKACGPARRFVGQARKVEQARPGISNSCSPELSPDFGTDGRAPCAFPSARSSFIPKPDFLRRRRSSVNCTVQCACSPHK